MAKVLIPDSSELLATLTAPKGVHPFVADPLLPTVCRVCSIPKIHQDAL